jgi:hypothetical protein
MDYPYSPPTELATDHIAWTIGVHRILRTMRKRLVKHDDEKDIADTSRRSTVVVSFLLHPMAVISRRRIDRNKWTLSEGTRTSQTHVLTTRYSFPPCAAVGIGELAFLDSDGIVAGEHRLTHAARQIDRHEALGEDDPPLLRMSFTQKQTLPRTIRLVWFEQKSYLYAAGGCRTKYRSSRERPPQLERGSRDRARTGREWLAGVP